MKQRYYLFLLLTAFLFLSGCSQKKIEEKDISSVKNSLKECYQESDFFELEEIGEPSGIVFDNKRDSLFVVSDEGSVYEISKQGALIKGKRISDGDFEGVTINPQNSLLYIAVENDEKILEINPEDFSVTRSFFISRYFNDKLVLEEGGNGIEGLHYDYQKNSFFAVNQDIDLDNENDKSALLEIEYPSQDQENDSTLNILNYHYSKTRDLSSITRGDENEEFFIVSDKENKLMSFSENKGFQDLCLLSGKNQEGLAFDNEGNAFVAQDSGGILKLFNRNK